MVYTKGGMASLDFDIVMPLSSADGYGYSGEELVLAAKKLGAEINVYPHDWQEDKYTSQELLDMKTYKYDNTGILVVYFLPYAFHHFRSDFQIGQTMFETTEIPNTWAQFCTIPNGLIVPSEFCKETFQKKVDKQIEVVPLGVNLDTYHYLHREPSETFTFLMAGLLHYRKGVEFAVKAFKEEFKESDPVRLVLKTRKGFFDIGNETLREDIEVVNWDYTRKEMLELYHAADCFISCSRGEASGLTPREAMATGLPTIVTDWGGLQEIAHPEYTFPLSIDGLEEAPVECSSYSAGITQLEPIGDFCTPSVEHLREIMRYVYEHQAYSQLVGAKAATWVAEEWNYQRCAQTWLDAIGRLYEAR